MKGTGLAGTGRVFILWLGVILVLGFMPGDTSRLEFDRHPIIEAGIHGVWLRTHDGGAADEMRVAQALRRLKALHVTWVAHGPELTMATVDRPELAWREDLESERAAVRQIRAAGFELMVLPRIESPQFFRSEDPKWRGDIAMTTDADWRRFHDTLESRLVEYAAMAAEEGVGIFSLGLEYRHSTTRFPERWRAMAAAVREVFPGVITYSANWYREYEEIEFWDALDVIGIGAYFPLGSESEIDVGWSRRRLEMAAVAQRFQRPIIFTEVGYPALADASRRPYDWQHVASRRLSPRHQARCFEKLFENLGRISWIAGVFVWQFHPEPERSAAWEYDPEGRPAAGVIADRFAERIFRKR